MKLEVNRLFFVVIEGHEHYKMSLPNERPEKNL